MLVYKCSTLLATYIIQIILSLLIVESSIHELGDDGKGSTDDKKSRYGMLCFYIS